MLMSDESASQHAAPMAAAPPASFSTLSAWASKVKKKKLKTENLLLVGGKRSQVHGSKDSFKGMVSFIPGKHEREGQSKVTNPRLIDLCEEQTGI